MIMRYKATLLILVMALALSLPQARAENYENERYREDVIETDGKSIRIKVDSNDDKVAYFWDDAAHGWVKAASSPVDLNSAYAEQATAKDMQDELNRMKDDTWDDRYRE